MGELMCRDALERNESCGCHYREEHRTNEGEARRDDERFAHVAAWQFAGDSHEPNRNIEKLDLQAVAFAERSYK